jgi:TalC/MipB family fructose-6-phosphate aldolase
MEDIMGIYVDSADLRVIEKSGNYPFIAGVTTNPKLIAKALGKDKISEKDFYNHIETIKEMSKGNVFVQTNYDDYESIITEAAKISKILDSRCIIKIPVTLTGYQAIKALNDRGIKVAATAVFTGTQACLAIMSGADFVIPYYSRVEQSTQNCMDLVSDILDILKNGNFECRLLVASVKNPFQVLSLLRKGIHDITIPLELIDELIINQGTSDAVAQCSNALKIVKGRS